MECGILMTARRLSFLISIVVHHGQKDVGNSFEPPRDMIQVGTRVLRGVEKLRGRRRFSA